MILFLVIVNSVVSTAAAPEFNAQASLWMKGSEKAYYYHSNHLGSVNVVTNDQGKVVERREYKPYGEAFEWNGPNSGPREFLTTYQGQVFDNPSGLYYMSARHYDPEIGQFLAGDTKVPDPLNPQTLNRYAFVGGNPIRYSDPSGHGPCEWVVAAIIILALVVLTALVVFTAGIALFGLTGVGAALLAGEIVLGVAIVGAGIGAGIGAGLGYSPGDEQFWDLVALGALSGAAIGAGICTGIILYNAAIVGAGWLGGGAGVVFAKLAGGAVFGACTGIWGYNIGSWGTGVRIENILSTSMFTSIGISVGIGLNLWSFISIHRLFCWKGHDRFLVSCQCLRCGPWSRRVNSCFHGLYRVGIAWRWGTPFPGLRYPYGIFLYGWRVECTHYSAMGIAKQYE